MKFWSENSKINNNLKKKYFFSKTLLKRKNKRALNNNVWCGCMCWDMDARCIRYFCCFGFFVMQYMFSDFLRGFWFFCAFAGNANTVQELPARNAGLCKFLYFFSFKNWFFLYTFLFVPSIAADFRVSYTLFFFYMFLAYAYTQHELFTPAVDKLQLIHILILLLVAFRSYYYSHSNTPLLVIYEGFSWWIPVSFE